MITASIIGATGFTGMVLTDLLAGHPEVRLDALTSVSYAGRKVRDVFPHLRVEGEYVPYDRGRIAGCDVAFVCYPHAEAHPVVAALVDDGMRVVDLSADFRLNDPVLYDEWYGFSHPRADLLNKAVYGLPESYREQVASARLVANPGCFPTGALLALDPLVRAWPFELVVIDAKSGLSGAGRGASEKTHFSSVHDNFKAYSEVGHRHTAEIRQELTAMARRPVALSFTPHLLPVERGILSTLYLKPTAGSPLPGEKDIQSALRERYRQEPFVEVVDAVPSLREVQYTNHCRLSARVDEGAGLVKVIVVIDNLVKGASGQAVQNMNLMFDLDEHLGLERRV
jgi:N-acetyl-gamma-glutamyl-phosphate reductase